MSWLRAWAPALLWAALIFGLSSMSKPPAPPGRLTDKHQHVAGYGVLSVLVVRGLAGASWRGVSARTALGAAALTTAYGATDEWHQSFVPGRVASAWDLAADAIGGLGGAGLAWSWAIIRRRP